MDEIDIQNINNIKEVLKIQNIKLKELLMLNDPTRSETLLNQTSDTLSLFDSLLTKFEKSPDSGYKIRVKYHNGIININEDSTNQISVSASNYLKYYNLFSKLFNLAVTDKSFLMSYLYIDVEKNFTFGAPGIVVSNTEFSRKESQMQSIIDQIKQKLAKDFHDLIYKVGYDEAVIVFNKNHDFNLLNESLKYINCKLEIVQTPELSYQNTVKFNIILARKDISSIEISNIFSSVLSKGEQVFFGLCLSSIIFNNNGTVLIDEPETHLHRQFINKVKYIFNECKSQFIITTHSPELIDFNNLSKVNRLSKGKLIRTNLDLDNELQFLFKYTEGLKNCIFFDIIILVEGEGDLLLFKWYLDRFYSQYQDTLTIQPIGGKSAFHKFKKLFESFGIQCSYIGDEDNIAPKGQELSSNIVITQQIQKLRDEFATQNVAEINKQISAGFKIASSLIQNLDLFAQDQNKITSQQLISSWNNYKTSRFPSKKFLEWLKINHSDDLQKIKDELVIESIYILDGDLENLTMKGKGIDNVIEFTTKNNLITKEEFLESNPQFKAVDRMFKLILKLTN